MLVIITIFFCICSGVSGSGKSVGASHITSQLCRLATHTKKESRVASQLQQAQQILDAFGCAYTKDNQNASMFSKFLEIQFNERGRILGGKTLCYLLNVSRITKTPHHERTFHVFYYLLHANQAAFSDQDKSQLRLQETFTYINQSRLARQDTLGQGGLGASSATSVPTPNSHAVPVSAGMGTDDTLGFEQLKRAMSACGFKPRQTQHIWRLLAAILHLGNLQFSDPVSASKQSTVQEAAAIRNPDILDLIADILGVPSDKLMTALTYKSKLIRRDLCTVVLNSHGAIAHRDSLARALYMALFGYLVEQINKTLCHSEPANFVAILDQPGLTEAPSSSAIHLANFEQFSVNFANELLHGFVGRRMLDDTVGFNKLQVQDGIQLPGPIQRALPYSVRIQQQQQQQQSGTTTATSAVLGGLVRIMDDSSALFSQGTATDADCLHKATVQMRGDPQSQTIFSTNRTSSNYFAIQHFTGKVEYSVDDFLEKNLDQISPDFLVLLRNSANRFIVDLFSVESAGAISVERHPKFEKTIVKAQLQTRPKRQPSRQGRSLAARRGANTNKGSEIQQQQQAPQSVLSAMMQARQMEEDAVTVSTVLSQVFTTVHDLAQTMDETTLWHMVCLKPNDVQTNFSVDTKKMRNQVNAFMLPEIAHRKRTEYTVSYVFSEFLSRYEKTTLLTNLAIDRTTKTEKGQCLEVANAPGRGWNAPDGKVGAKFALGNTCVWLAEEVWKDLEDDLRTVEKEERLRIKREQAQALAMEEDDDMMSDYGMASLSHNRILGRGSRRDQTLGAATGGNGGQGGGEKGGNGRANQAGVRKGQSGPSEKQQQKEPVEELPTTRARKLWVAFTWAMTWWIPSFMLSSCGKMKREDIRMAWREKVALCCIIFFMSAIIIFVITGFGKMMCPGAEHLFSSKEVGYHASPDDFYVSLRGKVYDITKFAKNDHSNGHASYPSDTAYMLPFAGMDLTEYFPLQLNIACYGIVTSPTLSLVANNTLIGAQLHGPPTSDTTIGWSQQNNQGQWYWKVALPRLQPMKKGELAFEMEDIKGDETRKWFVIDNAVYDMTSYFNTVRAPGNTGAQGAGVPSVHFLDKTVEDMAFNHNGEDVSDLWKKLPLDSQKRVLTKSCLDQVFYVGKVDYRKSFQCQFTNYMLLSTSVVLVSVIAIKFLAALQLGSVRVPEEHDKFVIVQIPCYTEDEDSLRKTIDSITSLRYDDKRKLLFIICDGMIIGSGNDLPTPRIVLNILGHDPSLDPEPLAFKSIGDGSKQMNMGKIYSGLYEHEGHVVPYIVVSKVGKPSERSRPGNRGKRDSQIILMKFLNKVHFDSPMCPLELEIYHQMKNVIGVNPSFYEYILQVDADTEVMPDALNRLISCMIHDGKIIGLCGETQLGNEENSWTTMIQVYEYYISHHLAKAFESLFGSVTCLPGCFCMYRVRTVAKSLPLIISSKVIEEYSDNQVDTLHKKNLLSLGEDRYLTTLMMKHFPQYKMTFTPDATCKTVAPDRWSVLLSQRRRWINSTIHNLAELMFLPEMCGFCCFSMRFVVFLDLFGTLTLPASVIYLVYLIVIVATGMETLPQISLILLGAVYGLQALIFIIKRQWQHIGWMFIYILAIPLFSFFIPVYSFWHFDDFSWGNTRMVVGETGSAKKVVILGDDEEPFDEKMIPMKKWSVYEQEMWEIDSVGSHESKGTVVSYRSKISEQHGPGNGSSPMVMYNHAHRMSISSQPGVIPAMGMPGPVPYASSAVPSLRGGGSQYGSGSVVGAPLDIGYHTCGHGHGQQGHGHHMRTGSTASGSVAQFVPPTMGSDQPTDEELANEIQNVLATADLMSITKKQVRERLMAFFGVDLTSRKEYINEVIERVLES
ncbi:glycosyltransferase family 2 protein [Linnemannia elongata AG-77]|uniref:chitin synthase n=1 Tax=Linnemannia elongata AG-77 TaxID=1314771 RepID=A0A197JG90_9FUNG|nr:glycosyltransferase family 2 protein [Linnemannia elongata AG-77]